MKDLTARREQYLRDRAAMKERYLRDSLPIRLGRLAANLARVESFSTNDNHRDMVLNLVDESRFFIDWTGPALDDNFEAQAYLAQLQRELTKWKFSWDTIWANVQERARIAKQAGEHSRRILELSGLLH